MLGRAQTVGTTLCQLTLGTSHVAVCPFGPAVSYEENYLLSTERDFFQIVAPRFLIDLKYR